MKSQTIIRIERDTANRGIKTFIVSQNEKGYFAHELGDLTQWAKVTGNGELAAHRLNPTVKRGNQYGRYFKQKPFTSISEAMTAITERADTKTWYF